MNRRQRRALAREVAKRQGLTGDEKRRVSSQVAKQLPGGSLEAKPEELEQARKARRKESPVWTPEEGLWTPE